MSFARQREKNNLKKFKIYIQNLTEKVIIGLLDFEREKRQKVIVNAEIEYNLDKNFLDYIQLQEAIINLLKYKKYDTLENALNDICKTLRVDFPEIISIKLKIEKPEISKNSLIGVEIFNYY